MLFDLVWELLDDWRPPEYEREDQYIDVLAQSFGRNCVTNAATTVAESVFVRLITRSMAYRTF